MSTVLRHTALHNEHSRYDVDQSFKIETELRFETLSVSITFCASTQGILISDWLRLVLFLVSFFEGTYLSDKSEVHDSV